MGGAIIYTVIVAVWAVVLVPRWLRSHDNARQAAAPTADETPHDEVHGRVLPRRQRPSSSEEEPDEELEVVDEERPRRLRGRSYEANARAHRMAVRRRVVFAGLLLAVAGTAVAAVYGVVPGWSVGAPTLLLPLYVVHVRRVMVAEHARKRRVERERARRPVLDTQSDDETLPRPTSVSAYRTKRVAPGMRVVEPGVVFDQDAAEPWQPRPVPLPTYLTAPAAPRSPQPSVSIDQYDEDSAPVEEAPVYDIRRAVGG